MLTKLNTLPSQNGAISSSCTKIEDYGNGMCHHLRTICNRQTNLEGKKKKKKRLNLFLFPRIKVNIQLQHYTFQIPSWDQNEKRQASYDLTVEKFPGQTVKQEVWIQI